MIPIIPNIGPFVQGRDFDFAVSTNIQHSGTATRNPIEDPGLSFVSDHCKRDPVRLSATFVVSTVLKNSTAIDVTRPARFYEAMLDLKNRQMVDPTALLEIYEGLSLLPNMKIMSIGTGRRADRDSQKILFDVTFEELRIADQPARAELGFLPNRTTRKADATLQDRAIIEGVAVNNRPPISIDLGLPGTVASDTGAADGSDVVADMVAATVPGTDASRPSTLAQLYDYRNGLIADFFGGLGLDRLRDFYRPN